MKIQLIVMFCFMIINNLEIVSQTSSKYKIDNCHPDSTLIIDEIVYTPIGQTLKSNIHLVNTEHYINVNGSQIQIIETKTGSIINEFKIEKSKDNSSLALNSADYSSGWIVFAQIVPNDIELIHSFSTSWRVPSSPSVNSNQLIYIFNGLFSFGSDIGILQPVLQWGKSPAGGGDYWAICNWFVIDNTHYFHDSPIKVDSGTELQGILELISQNSDTTYNYSSSFVGYNNSELKVNNISQLIFPYEALEAYRITNCSDYPADEKVVMSKINLIIENALTPGWLNYAWSEPSDDCGQHVEIINHSSSNGSVDIYFRESNNSVEENPLIHENDILIYPTFVESTLNIKCNLYVNDSRIEIYDCFGKKIQTFSCLDLSNLKVIDFQNYKAGIYIIRFYYDKKVFISKIIKI